MKAIAKTRPAFGAEVIEVPVKQPGPGELLVKVAACGICGSDLHIYEWELGADRMVARLPAVFGHEPAGEVVEAGAGVTVQGRRSRRARSVRTLRAMRHRAAPDDFICASRRPRSRAPSPSSPSRRSATRTWFRPRWISKPRRCSSRSAPGCTRSSSRASRPATVAWSKGRDRSDSASRSSARALGVTSIVMTGLDDRRGAPRARARDGISDRGAPAMRDWKEQVRALLPADGADVVFDACGMIDSPRDLLRRGGELVEVGWPARDLTSAELRALFFHGSQRSSIRGFARPRPGGARSRWSRRARSSCARW